MVQPLSRRRLLGTLAGLPAIGLLAACSDSAEAESTAEKLPENVSGETTASVDAPPAQGEVDVSELMKPGPLPEMSKGSEDAPVTIVEYASMTCSHCATFHNNTLPKLEEKYIDTGKVRMIFREFPFDPRAEAGFMLARCADDKYFPMVDALFKQQSNWAPVQDARTALLNIAKLAGFTQQSFEACLTNQELLNDVRAVRQRAANDFDVTATPTFFINGKKYAGALSIEEISAIIDPML